MPRPHLRTTTQVLMLVLLILLVPAAASWASPKASSSRAFLRAGYVHEQAEEAALRWALSNADATSWGAAGCVRQGPHTVKCDYYISGTHFGDLHCSLYSETCYETDTDFECDRTLVVSAARSGRKFRLRRYTQYYPCQNSTHTTSF